MKAQASVPIAETLKASTGLLGSRRTLLKGMALLGGGAAMMQPYDLMAMAPQQDMVNHGQKSTEDATIQQLSEHARPTALPEEAYQLPRWIPDFAGPYDLRRPLDNHYAFAKVQASLAGPQQPRLDYAFWTSAKDDIMNPSKRSIDCRRDYSSCMKLSEYPWMGAELGDQAQIMQHLTGIKTQNPARLPDFIRPLILDRFPGRYVI